jgi:hypothetical protein
MAYRRTYRQARPQVRSIVVKYAAPCACCGATIKAGEMATYYPPGTIASRTVGAIAHLGGLDGNSARCTAVLREQMAVNDYAGDGLDVRYEDQCFGETGA